MVEFVRWNEGRGEISHRAADVRMASDRADEPVIDMVLSTESPVLMWDSYEREPMDEILLASGRSQLPHVVLLDSHNRESVTKIWGHVENIRTEGGDTVVRFVFDAEDPEAMKAYRKYKNKHARASSVGYAVLRYEEVPAGQTRTISGVEYKARASRKTRVATQWRVDEGSCVCLGADKKALSRTGARGVSYQILDEREIEAFEQMSRSDEQTGKPLDYAEVKLPDSTVVVTGDYVREEVTATLQPLEPQKIVVEVNVNHIGETSVPEKREDVENTSVESSETVVADVQSGGSEINGESVVESRIESAESDELAADNGGIRERVVAVAEPTSADQTVGKTPEEVAAERKSAIAEGVKLEKERQANIRKAAVGLEVSEQTIQACLDDENCGVQGAERKFLDEIRAKMAKPVEADSPRGVKGANRSERSFDNDTLIAALALRAGEARRQGEKYVNMLPFVYMQGGELRMLDPQMSKPSSASQKRHEDSVNKAMEMTRKSQVSLCRHALSLQGIDCDIDDSPLDIVQRSFSTSSVASMYTNVVGAVIASHMSDRSDSTLGWCMEKTVPDFRKKDIITVEGGDLKRRERGEEADHGTFSAKNEQYQVHEYASQFKIDRQDIIDDSLDGWMELADFYADQVANLRPSLVYGFLATNSNMVSDNLPLFNAAHLNEMTGVGLSIDSLQQVSNRLAAMKNSAGIPIGLGEAVLIVSHSKRFDAKRILGSAEVRNPSATGDYGLVNPVQGLMDMRADVRLSTGFQYKYNGSTVAAAPNQYYVAAAGGKMGLVVGYLRDTNGMPRVRTKVLDGGWFGMQMDIQFDIGVGASDHRGIIRCNP
jgi:hypothetical protein